MVSLAHLVSILVKILEHMEMQDALFQMIMILQKAKMYANHGALKKHFHDIEGINSRMDGIQASILSVKLRYINKWTALRQENAKLYDNLLSPMRQVITPCVNENTNMYIIYMS